MDSVPFLEPPAWRGVVALVALRRESTRLELDKMVLRKNVPVKKLLEAKEKGIEDMVSVLASV